MMDSAIDGVVDQTEPRKRRSRLPVRLGLDEN